MRVFGRAMFWAVISVAWVVFGFVLQAPLITAWGVPVTGGARLVTNISGVAIPVLWVVVGLLLVVAVRRRRGIPEPTEEA